MELIIILSAFGFATGYVGRRKGGSFLLWFAVGFFMPLIGLIAVILSRSEHDEPERSCPRCGQVHKLYVQVCQQCGQELYLPDPSEVRPGSATRR